MKQKRRRGLFERIARYFHTNDRHKNVIGRNRNGRRLALREIKTQKANAIISVNRGGQTVFMTVSVFYRNRTMNMATPFGVSRYMV